MLKYYEAIKKSDKKYANPKAVLNTDRLVKLFENQLGHFMKAKAEIEKINILLDFFQSGLSALVECGFNTKECTLNQTKAEKVTAINSDYLSKELYVQILGVEEGERENARRFYVVTIIAFCFNEVMKRGHDFEVLFTKKLKGKSIAQLDIKPIDKVEPKAESDK